MRAAAVLLAVAVVLGAGAPAAATGTPGDLPQELLDELPEDLPSAPSRAELGRSVTSYDLAGSVVRYSLEDSVEALKTQQRTGATTSVTVSSDVLFAFGSDALDGPARTAVTEVATALPRGAAVQVVGHTDGIGADPDNQALSDRRARAVADVLRAARADVTVTPTGRGETEPLKPEGGADDAVARAANRRVVITYPE